MASLGDGKKRLNYEIQENHYIICKAVLNFVGGKNIMIPSDKANKKDAASICGTKGLELMSLDSLTQLDAVQDFMGDIGIYLHT